MKQVGGLRVDNEPSAIVAVLAELGWCVTPAFLGETETAALRTECLHAHEDGHFHAAGVGRGAAQVRVDVRGDAVLWVEPAEAGPELGSVLARLEDLRLDVNRSMFLGLFDLEAHFAVYPPGAGYQRHLDRFRDDDRRSLTFILYLNPPDWQLEDGGLLRFWPQVDCDPIDILPAGGTLVVFLSEQFWHEVLPARRQRLSLTGWFRRR